MRDRTADLLNANQALSHLSYSPTVLVYFPSGLRCTCRFFSCVHKYAPSVAPACALPDKKYPASSFFGNNSSLLTGISIKGNWLANIFSGKAKLSEA